MNGQLLTCALEHVQGLSDDAKQTEGEPAGNKNHYIIHILYVILIFNKIKYEFLLIANYLRKNMTDIINKMMFVRRCFWLLWMLLIRFL